VAGGAGFSKAIRDTGKEEMRHRMKQIFSSRSVSKEIPELLGIVFLWNLKL